MAGCCAGAIALATDHSDYLDNEPVQTYVPIPFPATYPRGTAAQPSPTGNTGGGTSDGNAVYAAALFFNAYCKASDRLGNWVRAADAVSTVTTTDSSLGFPAIGIIVSKTSDTTCVVQTYGLCGGIYSGLTPNKRLFVGPSGQASTGDALPSGTAYVQPIGFSVRADTIFVQPSGVLYRRDAAAGPADPAPAPAGNGESVSTYRPILSGKGAPDNSIGQLDDTYLASDTLLIYLRGAQGWGEGRQLASGGSSAPGQPGEPGKPGSRIVRVATLPDDYSAFNEGDFLIADNGDATQVVSV